MANDQFKHRHEFIDIIDDRFRREIVAFIREVHQKNSAGALITVAL